MSFAMSPGVREVTGDHNGFVLTRCPNCDGRLYDCTAESDIQRRYVCVECNKPYVIDPPIRFDNPTRWVKENHCST